MVVEPGTAVFVPFGPRVLQGVVLGLQGTPDLGKTRPIQAVADPHPVLDEAHIQLARWMADFYLAPLWECVSACLPSGYGQRPVAMVTPGNIPALLPVAPRDAKVLQYLAAHGRMTTEVLREGVGAVTTATLERLQSEGYLTLAQGLANPAAQPKCERRVALNVPAEAAVEEATRREARNAKSVDARVLRLLASEGDVALAVAREAGAGPGHIERLEGDGWLREYSTRVERDPLEGLAFEQRPPLALSEAQQAVADAIWAKGGTSLLHGVTGAGKTEVYLDLARRTLEAGKSAIVLVPEIALTPQAIRRYGERFGGTLAVLHSSLGQGEVYDQWFRVQRGDARVVIGSRSAIFAPAQNLGLVVLDEEHEWTYKQTDPSPRYHARAVAERL